MIWNDSSVFMPVITADHFNAFSGLFFEIHSLHKVIAERRKPDQIIISCSRRIILFYIYILQELSTKFTIKLVYVDDSILFG